MLKFYVRWRANPKFCPKSAEEQERIRLPMLKTVKADFQVCAIKDWGRCIDGSGGYTIWEMPSEADLFASLKKYQPYLEFDVRQVITVEQAIEYSEQALEKCEKARLQASK